MDTLKSSTSRKESKRLQASLGEPSMKLPSLTKLHSYPASKVDKIDSSMLSRKLLDEVRILTQENQNLRSMVSKLEKENRDLYSKWKQS